LLEIVIDRDLCMGSGNCVVWSPGVFELGDDGIAAVVDASAAPEETVLVAARGCPTRAIVVRRDGEPVV
jgi:ferredoxin